MPSSPCAHCLKSLFCLNNTELSKAQISRHPEGSCFKIPTCKACVLGCSGHCKNFGLLSQEDRVKAFESWDAQVTPRPECYSSKHSVR